MPDQPVNDNAAQAPRSVLDHIRADASGIEEHIRVGLPNVLEGYGLSPQGRASVMLFLQPVLTAAARIEDSAEKLARDDTSKPVKSAKDLLAELNAFAGAKVKRGRGETGAKSQETDRTR